MVRNGFSLTLLLMSIGILLVITPNRVRGECSCDNPDLETGEHGKVSDFFHKVGCGLKKGAKAVKDTVQDGYKFVKNKLSPTTTTQKPFIANEGDSSISAVGRDQEFIYDIDVRNGMNAVDNINSTGIKLL